MSDPGPARRTQAERTGRTRAALLNATIKVIAEGGYQSATTRRVAREAGVSLGAVAHHFPTRSVLMSATLGEVTLRVTDSIEAGLSGSADTDAPGRLLEGLWVSFSGESFLVWLRVWIASAHDDELRTAVAAADEQMSAQLAHVLASLAPSGMDRRTWMRRVNVALDAIRGLSLITHMQPGQPPASDRWPVTKRELERLLVG